jgi:hypothetical protein
VTTCPSNSFLDLKWYLETHAVSDILISFNIYETKYPIDLGYSKVVLHASKYILVSWASAIIDMHPVVLEMAAVIDTTFL